MGRHFEYREQARAAWVKDARKFRLVYRVVVVYFIILTTLAILVNVTGIKVTRPDGQPTAWLWLLWFDIYAAPFLLAVSYGLMFRPFWKGLRDCLVPILVIQLFYSGGILLLRDARLRDQTRDVLRSRSAHLNVLGFDVQMKKAGKDDANDRLLLKGTVDVVQFPPGRYYLHAGIEQNGKTVLGDDIEPFRFVRSEPDAGQGQSKLLVHGVSWETDAAPLQTLARRGPFHVNLTLNRFLPKDDVSRDILTLARWMPFFRFTSWDAYDPELEHQAETVDTVRNVAQFSLPGDGGSEYQPLVIGRRSDYGRDADGDGRYEDLVIEIEAEALYEGPVYIQAGVDGLPYPLFIATQSVRGHNVLELVVDGRYLRDTGRDGPYHFVDFQLSNQDPECTKPPCTPPGSLPFTVYLNPYYTGSYRLSDFTAAMEPDDGPY